MDITLQTFSLIGLFFICTIMVFLGLYLCFFGLIGEQKRTKLIYTATLTVYLLWVFPALMQFTTVLIGLNPEPQVIRLIAVALQGLGIVVAIYVSRRYSAYVFRFICMSFGVLLGLTTGVFLRLTGLVVGQIWLIVAPLALALLFGLIGWRRGAEIRDSVKIIYFSISGAALAASGMLAAIIALISEAPGMQLLDLMLSMISPVLKYVFLGFPTFLEVASYVILWLLAAVSGIVFQCRALRLRTPAEASVCSTILSLLSFDRRQ